MTLPAAAAAMIVGAPPPGTVYPAVPTVLPDVDAREYALRRLADFIAALVFRRTGQHRSIGFRMPRERIHVYRADDEVDAKLPAIAIQAGEGDTATFMGSPEYLEDTVDLYGVGKVLVLLGEYVEIVTIDAKTANHAVRRALIAGLEVALLASGATPGLRLSLPAYYDRVAAFTLQAGTQYPDSDDDVRGRRTGQLRVELRVPKVLLVPYRRFLPILDLGGVPAENVWDGNVYSDYDGTPFTLR